MSGSDLAQSIADIEQMDLSCLWREWRRRYGAPPPLKSKPILRMMLAWTIQADELGGLSQATKRALARKGSPIAEGLHLGCGAKFTRNWNGKKIEVLIEDDGFHWEGQVFSSLSAAATAIAGSKWNGPRFFGLRDDAATGQP